LEMKQLKNKTHNEAEGAEQVRKEIEKKAVKRAKTRAKADSWDLNIALFLFLVLMTVIVLLFQGIGVEIVAPIAIFGLACVWLVGWSQRRKLYRSYYEEELINIARESSMKASDEVTVQKKIAETVEEYVQKALIERWDKEKTFN